MTKNFKKLLVWAMSFALLLTTVFVPVTATADTYTQETHGTLAELASKTTLVQSREDSVFEITFAAPGMKTEKYNEIIVMIDASGSQVKNFDSVKDTIRKVGESVLNDNGSMRVTVMTFGISGTTLFTASTQDELIEKLNDTTNNDFKRELTATNCEASFVHLQDYINNSPNLEDAYIIYTTDGETNMSEEAVDWTKWRDNDSWHWQKRTDEKVVVDIMDRECQFILKGSEPTAPTKEIFGDIIKQYKDDKPEMVKQLKAATYTYDNTTKTYTVTEEGNAWFDLGWKQAYEGYGLTWGKAYSMGTVEKAFLKYDGKDKVWHYSFGFACLNWLNNSIDHHSVNTDTHTSTATYKSFTKGNRAAAECNRLAGMDKVEKVYLIGMNGNGGTCYKTSWMNASSENKANNTAKVFADHEKIKFIDGDTAINGVLAEIGTLGQQLSVTEYNDVEVTDYMSKWVLLDTKSVAIWDGDEKIYGYNEETGQYEWYIDESEQPTEEEPVTIEEVKPSEYAEGGPEVVGNTSGKVYKLTWKVTDDTLKTSDEYSMTYDVKADQAEEGFKPDVSYLANGKTVVTYVDTEGTSQVEAIEVPVVDVPREYMDDRYLTDDFDGTGFTESDEESELEYTESWDDYEEDLDEEGTDKAAQTGDSFNMNVYFAILVIAAAVMMAALRRRKKTS